MAKNIYTTKLLDVIVTNDVKDYVESDNKEGIFLVMNYVESDVKKVLESVKYGTILSEDHVITILYNIISCLKYLHSANIIHRDIKPNNLLIDSKCKISFADFGLSRAMNESDKKKR